MSSRRIDMDGPVPGSRDGRPQVVNKYGEPTKLSSYQKNALYRQAREIRERLHDNMCTRRETHQVDNKTVNKMIHSEFASHDKMREFKRTMQALGADPKDCDTERLRRR
jgi:hypothetical protein